MKIAPDRGFKKYQTGSFAIILYNTMPSEALVRVVNFPKKNSETVILFDTRPTQVTEIYTPIQFFWNRRKLSAATYGTSSEKPDATIHGNSTGSPLRDNSDPAQSCCSDFRVQGEPDQSTDDEERKRCADKVIDETNS